MLLARAKGADDVTMIGAERPDTGVAVILGVDTHLDFHVAVDHLGREAWARRVLPTTVKGYERLLSWAEDLGSVRCAGMHGDPALEQKMWLEQLAEAERKRSGFQDMAAEGLITFDELRAKLAALEETRTTAERELASLRSRREVIEELERDRDTLLEHYAKMVPEAPEALEELTAEERHQVYQMLRLEVYIHPDGYLEICGVLSEDVLYPDGNVSTLTC